MPSCTIEPYMAFLENDRDELGLSEVLADPPIRGGRLVWRLKDVNDAVASFLLAIQERDGGHENAMNGAGCTVGYQVLTDLYRVLNDVRGMDVALDGGLLLPFDAAVADDRED